MADATERELSAGERLKELLAARSAHSSSEGVAALAAAIAAAVPFSSLAADVAAARALHQQCCQRVEAAGKLQEVVEHVLQLTSKAAAAGGSSSSSTCPTSNDAAGPAAATAGGVAAGGRQGAAASAAGALAALPVQGFDAACWERCVALLEAAVEEAKEANVSVLKVRCNSVLCLR